jgi:hypothetical protein
MPTLERKGPEPKRKRVKADEDPDVSLWRRRLEKAEKKLKEKGGAPKDGGEWKKLIAFFEGEQWTPGMGGTKGTFHRVTANLIKANIDAIRPQLYFQNPRVRLQLENPTLSETDIPQMDPMTGQPVMQPGPVDMTTGQPQPVPVVDIPRGTPIAQIGGRIVDAQKQVDLFEAIDNAELEKIELKPKARRLINDALVLPYAVGKLEWVIETELLPSENQPEGATELKATEQVARQYLRFSRIKPWCFLWDTDLAEFDLKEARWCAEVKYMCAEDLENDLYLENVDLASIENSNIYYDYNFGGGKDFQDDDDKRYKVYEIHDLKNSRLMVWIEGSEKLNRNEENPYKLLDPEGSTYTLLGFDETINDSFPIALTKQVKSKQEAYNYLRSYAVNHAARAHRRYKVMEGAFKDDGEREKWEQGADMTTVEMKAMNMGPEPISDANIAADIYNVADIIKREITEDVGVSAFSRGTREPGVDTAYEASLIQGGGDIKIQEKRDIVREFVKKLVRKLNIILQEYADIPTVTQLVGLQGNQWLKWSNADIQGAFSVDVDIYSSLPYSQLEERKQAMEMFSLIQQDPYFDAMKVRQKLVRMMDWDQELLKTAGQIAQEQAAAQQAQMQQASMQQQQEVNRQKQSKDFRPSEGDIKRRPDMRAGIIGPARNAR